MGHRTAWRAGQHCAIRAWDRYGIISILSQICKQRNGRKKSLRPSSNNLTDFCPDTSILLSTRLPQVLRTGNRQYELSARRCSFIPLRLRKQIDEPVGHFIYTVSQRQVNLPFVRFFLRGFPVLGFALEVARNHTFSAHACLNLVARSPALWILVLLPILAQVIVPAPSQPDIAELIEAEEESDRVDDLTNFLAQATTRSRELFEGLPVACCSYDAHGHVLEWNRECERLFGQSAPHVLDRPLCEIRALAPIGGDVSRVLSEVLSGHRMDSQEWAVAGTDRTYHCLAYSYPLQALDGAVVGGITAIVDISDRKLAEDALNQANHDLEHSVNQRTLVLQEINAGLSEKIDQLVATERALRESEQRATFLAESMPQIVWTARPDGGIDYFNGAWTQYTGMTFDQTKEWAWKSAVHPEDLLRCIETWKRSLETGDPYEIEYRFQRGDDQTYRWHLGRANAMRDDNGDVVLWVGTCTDIDDQKRVQDQLRSTHEELEHRVAARTADLIRANETLLDEIESRHAAEQADRAGDANTHTLSDAFVEAGQPTHRKAA